MSTNAMKYIARAGAVLVLAALTSVASADGVVIKRNAAPGGMPFFSSSIWVGDVLYMSGMLPSGTVPAGAPAGTRPSINGDTRTQTHNVLERLQEALKKQGLDLGDVIQLHIYLVGDPALEGKMDFRGMNDAYHEFFGTKSQPNLPVRAAFQVAGLAVSSALVEIEAIAARPAHKQ